MTAPCADFPHHRPSRPSTTSSARPSTEGSLALALPLLDAPYLVPRIPTPPPSAVAAASTSRAVSPQRDAPGDNRDSTMDPAPSSSLAPCWRCSPAAAGPSLAGSVSRDRSRTWRGALPARPEEQAQAGVLTSLHVTRPAGQQRGEGGLRGHPHPQGRAAGGCPADGAQAGSWLAGTSSGADFDCPVNRGPAVLRQTVAVRDGVSSISSPTRQGRGSFARRLAAGRIDHAIGERRTALRRHHPGPPVLAVDHQHRLLQLGARPETARAHHRPAPG